MKNWNDAPVALITGAGRGLGRAIALDLACHGFRVAVNDLDEEAARATAAQVTAGGGEARVYVAPVDEVGVVHGMLRDITHHFRRLDAVVNNAGVGSSGLSLAETEPDEVERLFRVHVLGSFTVTRAALALLRRSQEGRVVFISSYLTSEWPRNCGPYTMAKSSLEALAQTLAKEELRHGIRVNVVAPTTFDTRLGHTFHDRITSRRPEAAPTLHDPSLVASVVRQLVTPGGLDLTGQRLVVGSRGPKYWSATAIP
jgi:NAD(P)-dependent dehydrogenase (short-subunit alcohol dehydrogenase family)